MQKHEAGFSLLEVLVAPAIVGTMAYGFMTIAAYSTDSIAKQNRRTAMYLSMQNMAETIIMNPKSMDPAVYNSKVFSFDMNGNQVDKGPINISLDVRQDFPAPNVVEVKMAAHWGLEQSSQPVRLTIYKPEPLNAADYTTNLVYLPGPPPTPPPGPTPVKSPTPTPTPSTGPLPKPTPKPTPKTTPIPSPTPEFSTR